MTSISDVVKKAKHERELAAQEAAEAAGTGTAEVIGINDLARIRYTNTRIEPVSNEVLTRNRVVAQNKEDPNSVPFAMLRAKVLQEMRRNDWTTLAITAPTAGAGKSLVAVNLAMAIAMEVNQTVLLVDMDLRKPSINRYFGVEPGLGVQDYLERDVPLNEIMFNPGVERLSVIPSRRGTLRSAETLASPKVTELAQELRNRYENRIIIYDLPPALATDDSMVFLPNTDCSLLIAEAGVTTEKDIVETLRSLSTKPCLGVILNKTTENKKMYVY